MCVDMMTKNFVPKNRSDYLRSVEIAATALWFVSIFTGSVPPSAYTTFEVENIAIDAGWESNRLLWESEMTLSSKLSN